MPELRRGLFAELVRPVRMLADGICAREGRSLGDPVVTAYAGALVGGMLLGGAGDIGEQEVDGDLMADIVTRIDQVRPILRLPPASPS